MSLPSGLRWRVLSSVTGRPSPAALPQTFIAPGRFLGRSRQRIGGSSPPPRPFASRAASVASSPLIGSAAGVSPASGPKVCVLGGGFGGLYTALRLESLLWPQGTKPAVTLIDQGSQFVFKPLLYDYLCDAASAEDVAPSFQQLVAPSGIRFLQATVDSVVLDQPLTDGGSATGGKVVLQDGRTLEYDWLVLALGAQSNIGLCEGAAQHALPFVDMQDATALKAALQTAQARGGRVQVAVVGAHYAGVELAAAVADRLGPQGAVSIITPGNAVLEGQPTSQQDASTRYLADKGVAVITGSKASKISEAGGGALGKKSICLDSEAGRTQMEADVVCWTAGSVPSTAAGSGGPASSRFPFPLNKSGMAATDPTLKVLQHARVFALGDVAGAYESPGDPGAPGPESESQAPLFPATAQVALQQADYAAWNIWASINNRTLLPFRYQHLGNMMSLGRDGAAVALNLPVPDFMKDQVNDSPLKPLLAAVGVRLSSDSGGVLLDGALGALARRAAYWYRQPTNDQKLRVGASWIEQGLKDLQELVTSPKK